MHDVEAFSTSEYIHLEMFIILCNLIAFKGGSLMYFHSVAFLIKVMEAPKQIATVTHVIGFCAGPIPILEFVKELRVLS